jgi:putative ABC transport system permease protein
MTMSVRERTNEFAVMKTLGFGSRHMAILIFGEAFAITGAGCAIGVILTYPAARLFSYELGAYFPVFIVKPWTIWLDIIASTAVAAASGIIPLYRVSTISIVSALRRVA